MFGSKRIPSELYELLFAALIPYCQCDVNCLLEFSGRIDVERLRNAFLTALAEEPMWSHRFVPAFWRPYWIPIPREERGELVQVIETDGSLAARSPLLLSPVDGAARIFVLRGPVDDTLCIRVDHRLGDATAASMLVETVAAHFAAGSIPATEDAPVVRRTMKLLRQTVSVEQRKKNLAELGKFSKTQKAAPVPFQLPRVTPDDPAQIAPLMRFPDGSLDELRARAMRDRGTPTLAITAATYLALRDVLGIAPKAPVFMVMAVNLRRYLAAEFQPAPASMFLGRAYLPVEEAGATTMSVVMEQLRTGLAKERGPQFGLIVSTLTMDIPSLRWLSWMPFALMRYGVRRNANNVHTRPDIAVNDQGEFGRPGDRWGDAVLQNGYCMSGIWGLPGTISICSGSCGSRFNIAVGTTPWSFAKKLADRMHAHLCEYVGWPLSYGSPMSHHDESAAISRPGRLSP